MTREALRDIVADDGSKKALLCDFVTEEGCLTDFREALAGGHALLFPVSWSQDHSCSREVAAAAIEDTLPGASARVFGMPVRAGMVSWVFAQKRAPVVVLVTGQSFSGKSSIARQLSNSCVVVHGDDKIFGLVDERDPKWATLREAAMNGIRAADISQSIKDILRSGNSRVLVEYLLLGTQTAANTVVDIWLEHESVAEIIGHLSAFERRVFLVVADYDAMLSERDGLRVERDGLRVERDWWVDQFTRLRSRRGVRLALRLAALRSLLRRPR